MTQKQSNPAAGADRARNSIAATANCSEYKSHTSDIQQFRTRWLARLRISPELAATIAPMVFGGEAKQ